MYFDLSFALCSAFCAHKIGSISPHHFSLYRTCKKVSVGFISCQVFQSYLFRKMWWKECLLSVLIPLFMDEVCAYLLWYVCSRGPLRPNLPRSPPVFCFSSTAPVISCAASPLSPPCRGLPAWSPQLWTPLCKSAVVKDATGTWFVFAAIEPAICGHVSLIRHFSVSVLR